MDLIAIHNRLVVFVRGHERGEADDLVGGGVLHEDVPEAGGVHFLELFVGAPSGGGGIVVRAGSEGDEGEAGGEGRGGEGGRG